MVGCPCAEVECGVEQAEQDDSGDHGFSSGCWPGLSTRGQTGDSCSYHLIAGRWGTSRRLMTSAGTCGHWMAWTGSAAGSSGLFQETSHTPCVRTLTAIAAATPTTASDSVMRAAVRMSSSTVAMTPPSLDRESTATIGS